MREEEPNRQKRRVPATWIAIGTVAFLIFGFVALRMLRHAPGSETLEKRFGAGPAANLILLNIYSAEYFYYTSSQRYGTIANLSTSGLLDPNFNSGVPSYKFNVTLIGDGTAYTATAYPVLPSTGKYAYYVGPDKVIRYSTDTTLAPPNRAGEPSDDLNGFRIER